MTFIQFDDTLTGHGTDSDVTVHSFIVITSVILLNIYLRLSLNKEHRPSTTTLQHTRVFGPSLSIYFQM